MAKLPAKLPWRKFFPADWLSDPALSMCSAATRGVWMDLLCAMYSGNTGDLTGTAEQLARIARCTPEEVAAALDELQLTKTANVTCHANVTESHKIFTVMSRRIARECKIRQDNKLRKQRQRCRAENHALVTGEMSEVRCQKSDTLLRNVEREDANAPPSAGAPAPKKTAAKKPAAKKFTPPDIDAVLAYGAEIGLSENVCQKFMNHYIGNEWRVGRNPMKDWKATLRNWKLREDEYHGNRKSTGHSPKPGRGQYMPTPADIEDRRRRFGLADTPGDG
jgi:hypothetical protein